MSDWTEIPDETFDTDNPVLGSTHLAIFKNFKALADGAADAPKIQYDAIDEGLAQQPAGGLGTYVFAWRNFGAGIGFGTTLAGSQLRPAGLSTANLSITSFATVFPSGDNISSSSGTDVSTLSGTWRCMGESRRPGTAGAYPHTLWLRIS